MSGELHRHILRHACLSKIACGRPLSGILTFAVGDFYNGRRTQFEVSPQFKLSRNLSIDLGYRWIQVSFPGSSTFRIHELNSDINYAFNQEWLTRVTFLVNSQDKEYAVNVRLNYIFRPGDDLFIVYNETRTYGAEGKLQNRALIMKVTRSWDF